jgi:hypothetical protein
MAKSSASRNGCHMGVMLNPHPILMFFVRLARCRAMRIVLGMHSVPSGRGALWTGFDSTRSSRDARCYRRRRGTYATEASVSPGRDLILSRDTLFAEILVAGGGPAGLLELNGEDLRVEPLEVRKGKLERLLAHSSSGLRFVEHMEGDGAIIFRHACKLKLEGIVSKRKDLGYRSGPSKSWLKTKKPAAPAAIRITEEGVW